MAKSKQVVMKPSRPAPDAERGDCHFCGDATVVAVSDQVRGKVTICESCAAWAVEQIDIFNRENRSV